MASYLDEIEGMIQHWLSVRPNTYHGSPYGADVESLLQKPLASGVGDDFLAKMLNDIPILKELPSGSINIYLENVDGSNDKKNLFIEISGRIIGVDNVFN